MPRQDLQIERDGLVVDRLGSHGDRVGEATVLGPIGGVGGVVRGRGRGGQVDAGVTVEPLAEGRGDDGGLGYRPDGATVVRDDDDAVLVDVACFLLDLLQQGLDGLGVDGQGAVHGVHGVLRLGDGVCGGLGSVLADHGLVS